jgi:DNA (cytosine-5)-methyltransferase 1
MGLTIDNFAGGGGASTGIEAALGRPVDIAINHDPIAVAMHQVNHPETHHYCQSVWRADPQEVVRDARLRTGSDGHVSLAWFSPDCKHFSKAKGGKPVEKGIRDLAWVVILWAKRVRPDRIMLENVEEFRTWGPLTEEGFPEKARSGETFDQWCRELKKLGYKLEHRELRACDYGAPTTRKRLFLIARCDGKPIVWPAPTHGKPGSDDVLSGKLKPWRTAAQIIDWTIPCPSIFTRKRPLKEATCRRIAAGIMRFVINAERPFIVPLTHHGSANRLINLDDPLPTITGANRGEMALVAPFITPITHRSWGGDRTHAMDEPLRTITMSKGGEFAVTKATLVSAFMAQHNTGVVGREMGAPLSTIVSRGTQQNLVTSHLVKLRHHSTGQSVEAPVDTITAGGTHFGEVRSFLVKYYGNDQHGQVLEEPLHTIPTRDRFGLVMVRIAGEDYVLADIGMRMLSARELFNAQSFPSSYIIDRGPDGKPINKTDQIGRCGNSVPPVMAEALVRANCADLIQQQRQAA